MKQLLLDKNIWTNKDKLNPHYRKLMDESICSIVVEGTSFLPDEASLKERIYCIVHEITEIPSCVVCDRPSYFREKQMSYSVHCSQKCRSNDPKIKNKRIETNVERYSTTNPSLNPEIQTKIQQTNTERYGVVFPLQNDNIRSKAGNGFKEARTQRKAKESIQRKYGVPCAANHPSIRNHITQKLVELKGVTNHSQVHCKDALPFLNNKDWLVEQHIHHRRTLFNISVELGVDQATVQKYVHLHNIPVKRFYASQAERDIVEWLTAQGITTDVNNRSLLNGTELDIVCHEQKVAIEYNGLFWHCEQNGKDRRYHLRKTEKAAEKGYQLIHIFEDEWEHKNEIVKSRLLAKLGVVQQRIYARECELVELDVKQTRAFLDTTHIQGYVNSSIRFGLLYEGELVAVMTFEKSRFNSAFEWELMRYSNQLNTTVVGGASKLYSHFIKVHRPTSVLSYSDRRWNNGNVYKQLGMSHLHASDCNLFYYHPSYGLKRITRHHLQKHKITHLSEYSEERSAAEILAAHGFLTLYDCGNDVFVHTLSPKGQINPIVFSMVSATSFSGMS